MVFSLGSGGVEGADWKKARRVQCGRLFFFPLGKAKGGKILDLAPLLRGPERVAPRLRRVRFQLNPDSETGSAQSKTVDELQDGVLDTS